MKLIICTLALMGIWATAEARAREGSELGNSFIPFDSKIGEYSLEYSRLWRLNDLSQTTTFSDQETSFLSVHADRNGPKTVTELREKLAASQAGVVFEPVTLGGLSGLRGTKDGVTQVHLLRPPGDLLSLRFRSSAGVQSDAVIDHMLKSFRAE